MKKIKGIIPKKVPEPVPDPLESIASVVTLVGELSDFKESVESTIDAKIEAVDQAIEKVNQTVADIKEINQGNPGKDADPYEVAQIVLDNIKIPVDGKDADEEAIVEMVTDRLADKVPSTDTLVKQVLKELPNKKADLKILQQSIEVDPLSVIDKIMALPEEKRKKLKLNTDNIDGLSQTIRAFQSQLGRGYLHGGGISNITGLISQGTNVTITGSGTKESPYVINASGGGSVGPGTANQIAYFDTTTTIASLTTATYPSLTELSYVKGVTSSIQTQLNAKQGTLSLTTTGTSGAATLIGNTLNIPQYAGTTYMFSTGLTNTAGTITVNTSQNISTLSNLTANGIVSTSGGTGALSVKSTTGSGNVVLATNPVLTIPIMNALFLDPSGVAAEQIYLYSKGGAGIPVPFFYPSASNTAMAFDISPNGTPGNTYGIGPAWFDILSTDVNNANYEVLRISKRDAGVGYITTAQGGSGSYRDLSLQYDFSTSTIAGNIAVGMASATAQLDIAASTTARSSLRLRSGSAPTSPNAGDMWFDGTHLQFRIGASTYQLDQQSAGSGATTALDNLASVAINTSLLLGTSDGGALGSTTKMWSDLFLASGAVINFNNGDVTLTHSTDALTVGGGTLFAPYLTSSGANATWKLINTNDSATKNGFFQVTYDGLEFGYSATSGTDYVAAMYIGKAFQGGNTVVATTLTTAVTALSDLSNILDDGASNASFKGTVTLSAGNLIMGANSITMTGSLAATGARVTKGWFTNLESTNMPTVGGTAILTSLTAPQFTTIELGAASDTTLSRVSAGVIAVEGVNVMTVGANQVVTGQNKFNNIIDVNNAITASANAATVPVTYRLNTVTNNSAATLTITMTTTSAVDGQLTMVRILDASAVAQTISWVNTENSTVSVPTTSNGSTTLPLTVGFQYNSATSKWRCIASA